MEGRWKRPFKNEVNVVPHSCSLRGMLSAMHKVGLVYRTRSGTGQSGVRARGSRDTALYLGWPLGVREQGLGLGHGVPYLGF